jgi:uncharacterized protein involved in exopolysaccharide biosynthesis
MDTDLNRISEDTMKGEDGTRARFLDYVEILVKWWRFIAINITIVTALAVILSLLLPKWYKATASILPPKDQGSLNLLGQATSLLRGLGSISRVGGIGQGGEAYNYFAVLRSRSVLEDVVRKFNLIDLYGITDSSMEKAVKELQDNASFEYQDDDYITIQVYDRDPQRAAAIANYFVDLLNRRSIELGTHEARSTREFIEKRLEQTRDTLRAVEERLKRFQEKSGILISPEQSASISSIADLYAMKAKKEIEVAILARTVSRDNEALQQMQLELDEIQRKLSAIPEAGLESYRLYREVALQQKIAEFMVPLYEQAKINEQKDVPVLLVLDRAVPPEKKAKPQRLLIVLAAASLSLFCCIGAVFAMHGLVRRNDSDRSIERKLSARIRKLAAIYKVTIDS